ncbi:M20/M25/M40 family metallo-hydrolase [Mesonia sp. K7]|uniref:M20/M25/M40 family metallo-hydrolase n=1 Tax=Mesonia sp. K7 TaxID=2218606 RepID=UPI000DA80F63|nr:M20/M25/M40 family metallo-hydrolase [Mesonia sp. K7]PZD77163.1 peptidase M28 [Mesonia sp. K7]
MRKLLFISLSLIFFSCSSSYEISEQSIANHLSTLASDAHEGRNTGTPGIEKSAVYIEKIFRENGLKPFYETYRDSFQVSPGLIGYNLIAYKEGIDENLKDDLIIIGAHYDHIGVQEEGEDKIANGANDNASGTVSVVELAKYFAKKKTKRSILFVLFSAEEMGLIGSKHLAKRMSAEKQNIYTLLNIEMVGVPLESQPYSAYLTGFDKSNMAERFNNFTRKNTFGYFEKAAEYQLFMRSDNYPFYQEMNIPAQTLCTFDFSNYPYYHHVDDEFELMDIQHMQSLISEIATGIEKMVNEPENSIQLNE